MVFWWDYLDVEVLSFTFQYVNLKISNSGLSNFIFMVVYTSRMDGIGRKFWDEFTHLSNYIFFLWCLVGDFMLYYSLTRELMGLFEGVNLALPSKILLISLA